jgi:hypothetical protein
MNYSADNLRINGLFLEIEDDLSTKELHVFIEIEDDLWTEGLSLESVVDF